MSEDMIEHALMKSYGPKRRELKDILSLNTELSFEMLKNKLISKGIHINEKTFLKNYKLVTDDGRYNLLADLLADENRIGLAVCVFKGKNKVDYLRRNEYGYVSLITSFQKVIDYCEALNETYVDVSVRPRREKRMFDNKAFEEAWINACVHNKWENGEPAVYWYEDRMEIVSQGGIPEGLTEEKFLDGVSEPVNPDLMEIFKSCRIVEKSGHGVPLVVEAYGKEAFDFDPYGITVTIPFDKSGFGQVDAENDKESNQKSSQKSSQKKSTMDLIIELVRSNPTITIKEIASSIGLSEAGVKKNLNNLKNNGEIKRVGPDKGGHWEIIDKAK